MLDMSKKLAFEPHSLVRSLSRGISGNICCNVESMGTSSLNYLVSDFAEGECIAVISRTRHE